MEFSELLWELVKKRLVTSVRSAEVISVDKTKDTCKVKFYDNENETTARLTASIDSKDTKVVIYPKPNSVVLVGTIQDQKALNYVTSVSEIDSIKFITQTGITLNGEDFGGLVKVEPTADKIKALEEKVNGLIDDVKGHTHPYVDTTTSGTVNSTTSASSGFDDLSKFNPLTEKSDLENTNVKHG
jgi:hypothetical protein